MSPRNKILVGIFIIGGALLFAAGLFLIGSRKQAFSHHYDLYADFDKVDTLVAGAKVRVSGMDAGEITQIDIPQTASGRFRMKLKVDEKFRPIIRQDSLASIETEGMIGNKFVNIQKGSDNSPQCPPGGTLPSREPFEIGDLMRQGSGIAKSAQATIDDLRKQSDTAINHITHLVGHVDGLVGHVDGTVMASRSDIKAITSNGAQVSENANALMKSVRQGEGAAGKLLSDPAVASNVSATIANAKEASQNAEQATQKVDATTAQLNQALATFLKSNDQNENTARMLRETVQSADRVVSNAKDDTEALKHNFFLRGFFKRRGFYKLDELTPTEYASTEFVKKPRLRVWVPAPGLFTADADGKQELSNEGRMILKQDMAEVVRYLPNNPIVVEGYSGQGGPDQRYLSSRQRATDVEEYLESSFHIDPKFLGIMPLGEHPPSGSGRESWDGVCLVLVVSKP